MTDLQLRSLLKLAVVGAAASLALVGCGKKEEPPAAAPAPAAAAAEEPAENKSKTSICHDKSSPSYKQTTNFTAFKTMDECVKSGGRPPKGSK